MLGPDPANLLFGIILVLSQPKLAFLGNDIKDLQALLDVIVKKPPYRSAYLASLVH